MILPSFFAFTCFDCFACTLPVSFTALGDPVCPGEVTRRCPRPWRGLPNGVVPSTGCLKHQSDPSLDSWYPAPTLKERPATAAPYRPRVSKNAECSGVGGVVPSMVFPSHRYPGTTLPAIRWRLAISSPSTVFPTWGYRGGDATKLALTSSIPSPSTVFPTCGYRGGGTADTWVGDARNISCWRRLLRLSWRRLGRLMLASPWALSLPWH